MATGTRAHGVTGPAGNSLKHRELLIVSLDKVLEKKYDPTHTLDAVGSKLFGIGSETYVVGSHEFYLANATTRRGPSLGRWRSTPFVTC